MRTVLFLVMLVITGIPSAYAQTETTVIARIGIRDSGATYHFWELFQSRDGWIVPDLGWIDFATRDYGEVFTGVGRRVVKSKHVAVVSELYLVRAVGSASREEWYVQPWTLLAYRISPCLSGEAVIFPYLPLNRQARKQWVVERIKLEREFNGLKVGAGYGAYQFGHQKWEHKPFVTITVKSSKLGDLEAWAQYLPQTETRPSGLQIQLRYSKTAK